MIRTIQEVEVYENYFITSPIAHNFRFPIDTQKLGNEPKSQLLPLEQ